MSKKFTINKRKLLIRITLLIILMAIVFLYFANRFVKSKGFEGISDFWTTYSHNKDLAANVEPENLKIIISDDDYDFLVERRQVSLDRGIQINKGNKYIDCKLVSNGDTIVGEMRLKGHMTDHLEGEKWSFRVKTEDEYKEMYRFSLQNPATRSYANEWVYHELLKSEDVIALKYDFIQLELNDKDLGIYAIEEHFGQHIPRDNSRPKGAILRWNPELFWEWRIREYDQNYLDLQDGEYQNSFVEPYDKGVVKKDSALINTYLEGAYLLETFRRGEKVTSEVFDVLKMARFHAVIDLVGGYHSLDWSDVKFFYNSETKLIEPVGYESFSVRETVSLAGQQAPNNYSSNEFDYHTRLFSDPIFFKTYIEELDRICQNEYLANFESEIKEELNKKLGILAHEFAYIKFSFDPYYHNISKVRQLLELKKPLHAFLENKTDSTLSISVSPVSDFPIEIVGLTIKGGEMILPDTRLVVPAKARDTYAHYFDLNFNHSAAKIKDLILIVKIPGGSEFEVEVLDFPSYRKKEIPKPVVIDNSAIISLNDSTFIFPNRENLLENQLVIGLNQTLLVFPGQQITIEGNGTIYSEGTIQMIGTEDDEIELICNSVEKSAIVLNNSKLYASHANISGKCDKLIQISSSNFNLNSCYLYDVEGLLFEAESSTIKLENCVAGQVAKFGDVSHSELFIMNLNAHYGGDFIKSIGSTIKIQSSRIKNYSNLADLDQLTAMKMWNCDLIDVGNIAKLNNASTFNTYSCDIQGVETGFEIDLSSFSIQESNYSLYKTKSQISQLEVRKAS